MTSRQFSNVHDVSWGTKGANKVSTDLRVVTMGKNKNKVEVMVPTTENDINRAYEDTIHILSMKPPKAESKPDAATQHGVGDSLDLVVVGGYYGQGKWTNVYGAFLLACYDADSEEYQTICTIGTGFSEEILQKHYDTLKDLELIKVRGDVKVGGAKPDVWFEPKVVWEVLTADLSLSLIYTAQGLVCIPTSIP